MQNPFEPNIKMEISELTNPFTPTTLGEGGFNSGLKLDNYIVVPEFENTIKRKRRHNLNAQRLYRQRNREDYNKYMSNLWKENKEANNANYKTWLSNQAIANKNYRFKKLIENPPEKTIERELRKEFKETTPKKVGRRKKNEKTYKEKEDEYVNDTDNINKMKEKMKKKYEEEYEEFLKQNADRKLSKEPVYVVGEYEYKQYDPTGLQVASKSTPSGVDAPTKLKHNLKELKEYYESVLTDIRPVDRIPKQWETNSRYAPPAFLGINSRAYNKLAQTNYLKKREKHKEAIENKYGVKETDAIKQIRQGEKKKD